MAVNNKNLKIDWKAFAKDVREYKVNEELSSAAMAKSVGTSPTAINNIVTREGQCTVQIYLQLCKLIKLDPYVYLQD